MKNTLTFRKSLQHACVWICLGACTTNAFAFFFFFPIPNFAYPPALTKIIDALEKSTETRALAYASEDKTFGAKMWTWGHHTGYISQEEADRMALQKCEANLHNAKAQSAGGQPLYNFGSKVCELHKFTSNETAVAVKNRIGDSSASPPVAAPTPLDNGAGYRNHIPDGGDDSTLQGDTDQSASNDQKTGEGTLKQIDITSEAKKAALTLGCKNPKLKVTGSRDGKVEYQVKCGSADKTLTLYCASSGVCLPK